MRLLRRILVGLAVFVVAAVAIVYALSSWRLSRHIIVTEAPPSVVSDSTSLARGQYLATAIGKCADCHGDNMGGRLAFDAGPVGIAYGPNLTKGSGGLGTSRSDADLIRALRHGVAPDGRKLLVMPSEVFQYLADADVAALVAYIRTLPPVDGALPATRLGPLGRLLYLVGQLPAIAPAEVIDHSPSRAPVPAAGPNATYGRYLANIGGCTGCHGPTLSGGHVAGTPPDFKPASNLTPEGIGHYNEANFFRALREGIRPSGTPIDSFMPWRLTRLMTDDDIRAVYAFLKTVPSKPFGGR